MYKKFDPPCFVEISLNANSTGLKYLKARSASFEVERGDVLAFILLSGEGDIGHATEVTNWEYHATVAGEVFPGTQITVSQTKLSLKHNIRAHLSTTSKVRISHKFTEPGFASLKIKATNPRYSEYQSEKYFHVQVSGSLGRFSFSNIAAFLSGKVLEKFCFTNHPCAEYLQSVWKLKPSKKR